MSGTGKSQFSEKTLIGNWFEERCQTKFDVNDKKFNSVTKPPTYNRYVTSSKKIGNEEDFKKKAKFFDSTDDWFKFQPKEETYKTMNQLELDHPYSQKPKFAIRDNALTKDQQKLEDYRKRWSRGNMDFQRTYLGAKEYKKAMKE